MPTEFERAVLAYESERIGRFSRVIEHLNDDETIRIPVAEADASPDPGLTSYATIGLSRFDNDLRADSGRPLRVELLATARSELSFVAGGLANCALNVASGDYWAQPGLVFPDVFSGYDDAVTTPHGLLWYPFQWDATFEGLTLDGLDIEWLLVLPITAAEMAFIDQRGAGPNGQGANALIDAFEASSTDVWDLHRASAL